MYTDKLESVGGVGWLLENLKGWRELSVGSPSLHASFLPDRCARDQKCSSAFDNDVSSACYRAEGFIPSGLAPKSTQKGEICPYRRIVKKASKGTSAKRYAKGRTEDLVVAFVILEGLISSLSAHQRNAIIQVFFFLRERTYYSRTIYKAKLKIVRLYKKQKNNKFTQVDGGMKKVA